MKNIVSVLTILTVLLSCSLLLAAGEQSEQKVNPGFEKLKSLVGDWQCKTKDGQSVEVSYKIISAGTGLMETMSHAENEAAMVTIYHLDGDNLMMTHYCSANNQPRMRAKLFTGKDKSLTFSYIDATNLVSSDAGHMHKLVVNFQDKDHFTQEWTWREKGKDGAPEVFRYERKK